MTKLRNVKLATKFVFRDEPGVWKKMTTNKAKCVFGPPDVVGTECDTDPEAQVFVIESIKKPDAKGTHGSDVVKVIFVKDEDEIIHERLVPLAMAMTMASADVVAVKTSPRKKQEVLTVGEVGFDLEARELLMEVIHRETMVKKKETKNENRRTTGKARGNVRPDKPRGLPVNDKDAPSGPRTGPRQVGQKRKGPEGSGSGSSA